MAKGKDKKRLLRTTGRLIELLPNLLFLLLYGIAMLSPDLSPEKSQIPAFLNMAFCLFMLLLLLALIFYLIRRKWVYTAVYLGVVFLSWGYLWSYFPLNLNKGLSKERDLRVMTYNVEGFESRDSEGHLMATDVIAQYAPDILALQEANISPSALAKRQSVKRYFGEEYPYIRTYRSQMIASKFPILAEEEIEYGTATNGSIAYLIQHPNGKKILVVNNHMESYALKHSEKEKYKGFIKKIQLSKLLDHISEIKGRLGPHLNLRSAAARKVQQELGQLVDLYQPDLTIVLGDLNDTPMSYTYQKLRGGMRDSFRDVGCGLGVSYNDPWMPFRIDHLFYSGAATAKGGAIPKHRNASDHNPLIIDFDWKEN